MLLYTELGITYIKKDYIYVKKSWKYLIKYLLNFNKIIEIKKKYIKFNKVDIKISLNNYRLRDIPKSKNRRITRESSLSITNINIGLDDISWAMNIEDSRVEVYRDRGFFGTTSDIMQLPQKYIINNIRIHQDEDRLYMKYDIKDAALVYYFIDDWNYEYRYDRCTLEILIGDELIDWDWIKTVKIEEIFKKIIENNRISIRLIKKPNIKNKYNLDESGDESDDESYYTCERFKRYQAISNDNILSDWTDDNWKVKDLTEIIKKMREEYYSKMTKYEIIKEKIWISKINRPIRTVYYKYKRWKKK